MGKRAKGMRHLVKMREKRAAKQARAAAYAALAAKGDNSKRKHSVLARPTLRIRDNNCKNIGDLISYPSFVAHTLTHFERQENKAHGYTGKYKHQLAYQRMLAYSPATTESWLDRPVKNQIGQLITRRNKIVHVQKH